ncbi:MAG TPA: citrate/2-methylcitrate synthase [Pirellulales bacterium]|jgi:citrate synthase|nr:citrate/2-methylcitrate synthase [Pirellulales bacterium]
MTEAIYSPGLEGVIAGETAVSTIEGSLQYRGYRVEELAEHGTFEETAYLLLHGELPGADELAEFHKRLATAAGEVPEEVITTLRSIPPQAPAMDVLRTGTSMLAHWDRDVADNSHEANVRKAERLLAQLPVLVAARQRLLAGKEPVGPDAKRLLAANFLGMLTRRTPSERMVRALDVSLVLYAEHEFNASTFTARVVCSTLSDLHSAIVAGIGALKGPLHGGANERVLEVLQQVGTSDKAEVWIRDALAKKLRVMGFGHRVYKDGDPRAVYLKKLCGELAEETGHQDMERMAEVIETIVRNEKRLPPNLDWPSARLFHYLGLPVELYTPLFVMSRVAGWSAHVIEQLDHNRLIRPRSRYTGPTARAWVPIGDRRSG